MLAPQRNGGGHTLLQGFAIPQQKVGEIEHHTQFDQESECALPDEQGLVVARGEMVYTVLNLYPYNPGHLMVVPYRHIPDYTDLDPAELAEFSEFTRHALTVIRTVSAPHGFNIGINDGVAAGQTVPHLHLHLIPRYFGDVPDPSGGVRWALPANCCGETPSTKPMASRTRTRNPSKLSSEP